MSFSAEVRSRTRPVLPLAAMVDIMFLLLIFFITSSTLRQQADQIDVSLPTAKTGQAGSTDATRVNVSVTKDGTVYLGTHAVTLARLGTMLDALAKQSPNESLVIRGDKDSHFGIEARILDMARSAGLVNARFGVVASKPEH